MYEEAAKANYAAKAGAIGGMAIPERIPAVSDQLNELSLAVEDLQRAAGQLCERLIGVQRDEPPSPTGNGGISAVQTLCPVATRIREMRNRVQDIVIQLDGNRSRLEI